MGKRGAQALSKNPNWKGGRTIASNGYVLIKRPDHPMADVRGYVYEHRLVAEEILGRPLREGEQVHHKNRDKADNRPENIEVFDGCAHHAIEHRTEKNKDRLQMPGEANPSIVCLCGCGRKFLRYDADGRPRSYISGHNVTRNSKGQFEVIRHG